MNVLVADAVRSPLCLADGGGLAGVGAMELVQQTVDALLQRAGVDPGDVDHLFVQTGAAFKDHLLPGDPGLTWSVNELPARVPAIAVDRWCGTSQFVMHEAARSIERGAFDIAVVVGVEAAPLTPIRHYHVRSRLQRVLSAERLAEKWGMSRQQLDEYAVRSHRRAAKVSASGEFDAEIVPISGRVGTSASGLLVDRDETIDAEASIRRLATLPTILDEATIAPRAGRTAWSLTEGNTAPPAIGSAAVLLINGRRADRLGIRPLARLRGLAVAGADTELLLAAPIAATRKVLATTKATLAQLDHVEVDEEFACIPLALCCEFSIDPDVFNPRGGALALGSPRACGGLRQLATMLSALCATGGRFGLQTMNSDDGNAYATLIERY